MKMVYRMEPRVRPLLPSKLLLMYVNSYTIAMLVYHFLRPHTSQLHRLHRNRKTCGPLEP